MQMQQIVCTEIIFSQFKFPSTEQQMKLVEYLQDIDL